MGGQQGRDGVGDLLERLRLTAPERKVGPERLEDGTLGQGQRAALLRPVSHRLPLVVPPRVPGDDGRGRLV